MNFIIDSGLVYHSMDCCEYIGPGDSDVISSYHLCQLFSRHVVGKALQNVSYSGITFLVGMFKTDNLLSGYPFTGY